MTGTRRTARRYDRWAANTEGPLMVLAVVFLVLLLVPLAVQLTSSQEALLDAVGLGIWAVFAADYAVRLYLAPSRWQFVRTHVLDLVVIVLPALRPLRAARVLTLLRGLSVLGYLNQRVGRSLHARVGVYVGVATVVVIGTLAVVMYDAERRAEGANITSLGDALWWAVTTVTTVGYGDRFPTTTEGRLVAVALMLVGIALLGVVTASVAAWFVSRLDRSDAREERTEGAVAELLVEVHELRAAVEELRTAMLHVPREQGSESR